MAETVYLIRPYCDRKILAGIAYFLKNSTFFTTCKYIKSLGHCSLFLSRYNKSCPKSQKAGASDCTIHRTDFDNEFMRSFVLINKRLRQKKD
jgi:hypothetical protein